MEEKFHFSCCGEPMVQLGLVDCLNPVVDSIRRWICRICGHGVDLVHFDFDAVELQNELETCGERLSPATIHQLKGGEG